MPQLAQNLEIGENIGSATIAGCTRAADGTLTVGTIYTLLTVLDTLNPMQSNDTERASVTASPYRNNIKIESGTDYEITGKILKNDSVASATNRVRQITQNFDYVQIVHNQAGVIWTYYGLIENFKPTMNGKGALTFSCNLLMVDIGGPNPVQS
jgi:hypothetical protein